MSDEMWFPEESADADTVYGADAETRLIEETPEGAVTAAATSGSAKTGLLDRLETPVEVRFGSLRWSLKKLLSLRVGDAVPVGADGDDTVTLYVQGRPYAEGELVVIDGKFAFRVRGVIGGEEA